MTNSTAMTTRTPTPNPAARTNPTAAARTNPTAAARTKPTQAALTNPTAMRVLLAPKPKAPRPEAHPPGGIPLSQSIGVAGGGGLPEEICGQPRGLWITGGSVHNPVDKCGEPER